MANKKFQADQFLYTPGTRRTIHTFPTRIGELYSSDDDHQKQMDDVRGEISERQELLYADARHSALIIFQGMDTAGKDSAIKHMLSGLNPQGTSVVGFRAPSEEELKHDFLWRTHHKLPARGMIGIFNRSYYEEVTTVRVHPEFLERQFLPAENRNLKAIWKDRLTDIVNHEAYLCRQGYRIIKFYLHLSKEEQKKRLLKRIEQPEKNWKFDPSDLRERGFWDQYARAYTDCLATTSTDDAPWYVIPADDKKNARLIMSRIILSHLKKMKMDFPEIDVSHKRDLGKLRKMLEE